MLDVTPQTDAAVARRHDNGERGTGSEAEVRSGANAARWRPFSPLCVSFEGLPGDTDESESISPVGQTLH